MADTVRRFDVLTAQQYAREGRLSIRDGNHRYEAMRQLGWPVCWALIWYNTEEDYHVHTERLARAGRLR
jgi:hypothetical protein